MVLTPRFSPVANRCRFSVFCLNFGKGSIAMLSFCNNWGDRVFPSSASNRVLPSPIATSTPKFHPTYPEFGCCKSFWWNIAIASLLTRKFYRVLQTPRIVTRHPIIYSATVPKRRWHWEALGSGNRFLRRWDCR